MSKSIKNISSVVHGVGVKKSMKSPIPQKPHSLIPDSYAMDGLINMLIGFGTKKDKAAQSYFELQANLEPKELEAIYQNNWFAKIIDFKVFEMLRAGWTVKCPELNPDDLNRIDKEVKRLKVKKNLKRSLTDAAIYGGSSIFAKFDDDDHNEPITYESIKGRRIQHLLSYDRWNMPVVDYDFLPLSANYLMPMHYTIAGSAQHIHYSRVISFPWQDLPLNIRKRTGMFWGDSELTRPYNAILNSEMVIKAIANLICESSLDVFKIPGLMGMLKNSPEEKNLHTRLALVNQFKSILNAVLIDANESLEERTRTFTGLPDAFDRFINIIAAASDIPRVRLMCENVSGLGSNGESGLENFYTMVSGLQENRLLDQLYKIYNLICATLFGQVFEDFTIEFNPLWSESKKDKAEREGIEIDNLGKLETQGIPRYMILQEIKKKGLISTLDDEYIAQVKASETSSDMEPLRDEGGEA